MLTFNTVLPVGLYFIFIALVNGTQNLPSGATCSLLDGSFGVCKLISTCIWTKNQLGSRISFDDLPNLRCGHENFQEITCCGDVQPPVEKMKYKRACDSYRPYRQPTIPLHILNGTAAALGEFPHMAALGYYSGLPNEAYRFLCGGSLISDRYILTAAHCSYREKPIIARLGTLNIINPTANPTESGEVIDVAIESFTTHPNYSRLAKYDDIALIRLATTVLFNNNLHPACLNADLSDYLQNPDLLVTGWGVTDLETLEKSQFLLKANLIAVNLSECNKKLEKFFTIRLPSISSGQFCAIDPEGVRDSCSGDSGGPIQILDSITDNRAMPVIVGVTSTGIRCGNSLPSIYARVAYYLDWIETIVWPN